MDSWALDYIGLLPANGRVFGTKVGCRLAQRTSVDQQMSIDL